MTAERPGPIVVIGRGHSGTRVLAQTLFASGVLMGHVMNPAGDLVPPKPMYEACCRIGEHVRWLGELSWDFDALHDGPVDDEFEALVLHYLRHLLKSDRPQKGWKLPETTLAYPWIARMLPEARYIHIVRDPRDALLGPHVTDDLERFGVPGPEIEDKLARRVASWKYQDDIVEATPRPDRFLSVRFEDLVLDLDSSMQRLEHFLEIPLARIVVDPSRVELWKHDESLLPYVGPLSAAIRKHGYV